TPRRVLTECGEPDAWRPPEWIGGSRRAGAKRPARSRDPGFRQRRAPSRTRAMEARMLTGWRDFDDTLRTFDAFQRHLDRAFDVPLAFRGGERAHRRTGAAWPATNVF